nr:hypothetical protein [uncultured Moraxella sp.]
MSAIIKAIGVTFNDPTLPVLAPLITQGLVGAWRPNNSSLGLIDLSGNGHILTQVGNPTLTDNSIVVDKNNGFATDVKETIDLTMIVVHRAVKSDNDNLPWESFTVGCFYDNRGTSIWQSLSTEENKVYINAQTYGKKIADGTMHNRIFYSRKITVPPQKTDYIMTAFVVKASDNIMTTYQPQLQATPTNTYDATPEGYRLDLRHLSDPATNLPNYFKFGLANVEFGNGKSEIAEVLIYNRALNQDEIMRQYKYSQAFLQKHRSIVI